MQHSFPGWTVVEKLGEGGMCAVYRVRRESEERAIKVLLDLGMRDRFIAEARILMELDHPNVVDVHALVEGDPTWIEMELLGGRDLRHHRDDGEKTSPEQAARWIAAVASGLAAVHAAGLVHRDIKPGNLMLGNDGVVRLIDFGIARQLNTDHHTARGMLMGTAAYLGPEMFTTANPALLQDEPTADVYALGQTLCELLIGRPVHTEAEGDGVSMARLMAEKLSRDSLDPREWAPIPHGLAAIVMRATAADPEERLQSAAALEESLRTWLADRDHTESAPVSALSTASDLPPLPGAPVHEPARFRWKKLGAAGALMGVHGALVALTLVAIGALWLARPQANDRLAQVIAGDERLTNCIAQPARFVVRATSDGVQLDGLSDADAACVQVLGWRGSVGATAVVEVTRNRPK